MQKYYVLLFVFISLNSLGQERRFEIWNKTQFSVEPWENISIDVSEKLHYSTQNSELSLKYGDIFIGHDILNWLEYGAGFRVSYVKLEEGGWLQENRPMLFVNLDKDFDKIEFDFYNRFEYRSYKDVKNYFRYRQSLRMKLPALTGWGLQFYLQEESFIKLNSYGTHLARFYSGLTAYEKEHFELKIYYALQKQEVQSNWLTSDIVGLNLSFEI